MLRGEVSGTAVGSCMAVCCPDEGKRSTDEGKRSTDEGKRSTDEGKRSTDEGKRSTVFLS